MKPNYHYKPLILLLKLIFKKNILLWLLRFKTKKMFCTKILSYLTH